MYLNIVNDLSFKNKRDRLKTREKKSEEQSLDDTIQSNDLPYTYENFYHSIFYGQLTQNWLKVTK